MFLELFETFHFFPLLKAQNTWKKFSEPETYIYANLDRKATFTLINCRLHVEKKSRKGDLNEMSNIMKTGNC